MKPVSIRADLFFFLGGGEQVCKLHLAVREIKRMGPWEFLSTLHINIASQGCQDPPGMNCRNRICLLFHTHAFHKSRRFRGGIETGCLPNELSRYPRDFFSFFQVALFDSGLEFAEPVAPPRNKVVVIKVLLNDNANHRHQEKGVGPGTQLQPQSQGLLGPEGRGGELVPAQIDAAERATRAQAVIVSVGADDLDWAAMLRLCAVARTCNDRATTAYFQQQLATFSKDYFQLLSRLADLPSHPQVIINRYYDPFDLQLTCLAKVGLTSTKLRTLNSRLTTLNAVLAKGAAEFGFTSVRPDFAGHQLCTQQPSVQGRGDPAPFHPTAEGQLAIALADQAALSPAIMPSSAAVQTPSPAPTPPR